MRKLSRLCNIFLRHAVFNPFPGLLDQGADVLGLGKIVSEDSIRRAFKRGTPEQWDRWLTTQERAVYEPLMGMSSKDVTPKSSPKEPSRNSPYSRSLSRAQPIN